MENRNEKSVEEIVSVLKTHETEVKQRINAFKNKEVPIYLLLKVHTDLKDIQTALRLVQIYQQNKKK